MSWKTILLIVITALLLLVWLPWIIVSVRKVLRETSGPSLPCHPELAEGSHPTLYDGAPQNDNENKK